ncbi:glucosylglycerol-phosphate synthase [Rubricella aquisinus]|uniref:Glucosylglycerol-phosphate synthase n=1 Tax=Rubricella aquisinus TaxID=2028108 RepID=A0A840X440_9RHOB|nr:glucosylglycerol-phosphate synthase [Rubricella aquisinus]MBB5516605.1 glucosylglycerol-phosphate synthase [Rubricella aquisinus]
MKSDLVIVYHRQPYEEVEENGKTVFRENKSPNGIVPTLKGFFGQVDQAAWVAWKLAEDPSNPGFERQIDINDSFGSYRVSRLPLTDAQVKSFYHVSSKEAFWPILHGFKERYNYDPVDWSTFREVNWAFAEAAAAEASDDAVVWIHDYNLWLVPGYLRQLKPNVRIAFYHHTPFPSADMFNVLPWREEIIDSLLACDAVGFHIPRYSQNFAAAVRSLKGSKVSRDMPTDPAMARKGAALADLVTPVAIAHEGREVRMDTNPVGVNFNYIETLASTDEVAEKVKSVRAELGDCQLVLSVSRTDYTKGNIEQLETFERLLQRRPELKGKVRLMLVSVGANRNMTAYEEVQQKIEELTGRINGTFGSFEWQPVSLISSAIPLKDLVAYYRAADVASITPLADGLNLVASEFCAAKGQAPGALILSEFAGCAVLLDGAIPVNPFSHASMDSALDQALAMQETEALDRMKRLRQSAARWDIESWTQAELALFRELGQAKTS